MGRKMKQLPMFEMDTLEGMEQETLAFIRENLSDKGESFVGFSGGKDSIVTAELMRMSGVKYKLFHSFTGIDAPEVVRFIRKNYPDCELIIPKRSYWRELSVNCPPSDRLRWCCNTCKKNPALKYPNLHRVFGIRREESTKRKKCQKIDNYYKKLKEKKDILFKKYHPILYWKEWHVWDFIEKYGLKYPSLYDEGFSRIGCVVCPYHSEKTGKLHQKYRDRWPHVFKRFEREMIKLYHKRVSQGNTMFYDTPEEFLKNWYLDDSSRWYIK